MCTEPANVPDSLSCINAKLNARKIIPSWHWQQQMPSVKWPVLSKKGRGTCDSLWSQLQFVSWNLQQVSLEKIKQILYFLREFVYTWRCMVQQMKTIRCLCFSFLFKKRLIAREKTWIPWDGNHSAQHWRPVVSHDSKWLVRREHRLWKSEGG